jgi:hypothetical protein
LLSIDWLFRPKTIITADAVTAHRSTLSSLTSHPSPLYMYMFTWRSPVSKGSVHGQELKFCFNTLHRAGRDLPQPSEADKKLADVMSSVWAQFAHTGDPNIEGLPQWQPYTKENGELMVFDHQCELRHNHDRKLAEIIDMHCFQQLDDFRAKQKSKQLTVGDVTMTIYPERGGKIMSLKYKGKEIISQTKQAESFGSTFWTSPQKEWNWPPVPEFDKNPYTVEEKDGRLILTSEPSARLKYRIRKEFTTIPSVSTEGTGAIVVTYSIINESDETRQVAPWEITRVENRGGWIFFDAPTSSITPAGLMNFEKKGDAVWYQPDETGENRKINADGRGWLAYANDGLLMVKQFQDLKTEEPAPDEAEIQVYVNRGKTYIELESQGAYTTLEPGKEFSWTVGWYLQPTEETQPTEALKKQVLSMIK